MIPTDIPFEFKQIQFSIRVAFVMTINKSQGQSLSVCGLNLEDQCFSLGKLRGMFTIRFICSCA